LRFDPVKEVDTADAVRDSAQNERQFVLWAIASGMAIENAARTKPKKIDFGTSFALGIAVWTCDTDRLNTRGLASTPSLIV
jgi:hypothetical protein